MPLRNPYPPVTRPWPPPIPDPVSPHGLLPVEQPTANPLVNALQRHGIEQTPFGFPDISAAMGTESWAQRASAAPTDRQTAIDMGIDFAPLPIGMMAGAGKAAAKIPKSRARPSMYDVPAGSKPRYLGAAPDRSDITYTRYNPDVPGSGGTNPRTVEALDAIRANKGGVKTRLMADIKKGRKFYGEEWYNAEEALDWFRAELGPKAGFEKWREYMYMMGAGSTGNKVMTNIRVASWLKQKGPASFRKHDDTIMNPAITKMEQLPAEIRPPPGYGHKMGLNHIRNATRIAAGEWNAAIQPTKKTAERFGMPKSAGVSAANPVQSTLTRNPKPKGFTNSLLGNPNNVAADVHFTRWLGMATGSPEWLNNAAEVADSLKKTLVTKYGKKAGKYFFKDGKGNTRFRAQKSVKDGVVKMDDLADEPTVFVGKLNDNEYRAAEEFMRELAEETGMTVPQVQASIWMGANGRTGVAKESLGSFMQLMRNAADKRAAAEGLTRAQVLKRFITEDGLLSAAPIGAGIGGAGLMGINDRNVP
jgi:hypothetical protein